MYERPDLYQRLFAYRTFPRECDAITSWSRKQNAASCTVLELASGPADHGLELARRGWRVTVVDLEPAMLAFATARAETAGVSMDAHRADVRAFDLHQQFDVILFLLDSVSHIHTLDELISHFESVSRHLAPGGSYVLECSHPQDFLRHPSREHRWSVDLPGGGKASIRWGLEADTLDPITLIQYASVRITLDHTDDTNQTTREVSHYEVKQRRWTHDEIRAAAHIGGAFLQVAEHGAFDTDTPLDSPSANRMIFVFGN